MTPEKTKSVFAWYRAFLDREYPEVEAAQMPGRCTTARSGGLHYTIVAAHYKFMCDEAQRFVDAGRIEKAMRWLGFLQGAFWRCGRFTLDDLKNHLRPDSPEG